MKAIKHYRPKIRSRHPSHQSLRKLLPLLPFKTVIRLGSTTEIEDTIDKGGVRIEINSTQAIKNSSNKLLMKRCFERDNVRTAFWSEYNGQSFFKNHEQVNMEFPIVAKSHFGSKGKGNTLLNSNEEFQQWKQNKNLSNYIFEQYYNYNKEYRLHIDGDNCFYSCRKMLKQGTPENEKWHRHDSNSVWILQDNPSFDLPNNWNTIIEHSIKALKAVGLDVGAVDVKVQNNIGADGKIRNNPDFIIIEINSAPSFGDITREKYIKQLPIIAFKKWKNQK